MSQPEAHTMLQARRIRVTGLVQGVGFRPFVWRLAQEHKLAGWVRNDAAGVEIMAEGAAGEIERFVLALQSLAPPLARVDAVASAVVPTEGLAAFFIDDSRTGEAHTMIGADTAVCDACLTEMFSPADRRWRHAFITCTHCGPRYTLTSGLPYDRARTSMASFTQCPACQREYADPAHRRFHSETNCCPVCGPRLALVDAKGAGIEGDAIASAVRLLREGAIVAVKGLGGFHLACDARNAEAVARLRVRKERDEKPFAVMAASVASLTGLVEVSPLALTMLTSRERPIVLVPRIDPDSLPGVAPGLDALGIALPYTPLQWLLFHEAAGRPAGVAWTSEPNDLLLVMTSANPGGEPLTIDNAEALTRLAGIADAWLFHDREILIRCDDSVLKADPGGTQFLRRARGYTPSPLSLPREGPCVLALGAWLKSTICVTRDAQAWVSQHIGDLDNGESYGFLEETVSHLLELLDVSPVVVAHDLHPDFSSTRLAGKLSQSLGVRSLAVQHHHAHIAAVAAEFGFEEPLIGLSMDGVGLGTDGKAWGGELLLVDDAKCERLGHLSTLPMPGGDRAAREPWRMGAAVLWQIGRSDDIASRFVGLPHAAQIADVLERRLHCPETTSLGRVFDAAASLLGVRDFAQYEGQAAMQLEALASRFGKARVWHEVCESALPAPAERRYPSRIDMLPLLGKLVDWRGDTAEAAARFHATLADMLARWAYAAVQARNVNAVALGGGCFLNTLLIQGVTESLESWGIRTLVPHRFPPNDGAISLGQAWIALHEGVEPVSKTYAA